MCHRSLLALLFVMLLAACGGGRATGESPTRGEAAPEPAGEGAPAQGSFGFTTSDLDAYALGIAQEIALVQAAQERAATATDPNERGRAIQAQWEDETIPEAARLAGIDGERYRRTREAVHEVFETLDFQGKIDGPMSIDLSLVDEATRARIARDPFADLPAASADALRARMDELVPLWSQYVTLTAVAG